MLVLFPDERLRQISKEVDLTSDFKHTIEAMFSVMYEHKGIGLSAIQIGVPLRLIVADVGQGKEIYINPKIERIGGTQKMMKEGCLSFPGIFENVMRFTKITISYKDVDGNSKTLNTSGIRAQMLQHEIEHLDGILLGDTAPQLSGRAFRLLTEKAKGSSPLGVVMENNWMEGHDEPCHYCKEICNCLAANPGLWPIAFPHEDDPGVVKWHHTGCVMERLSKYEKAVKAGLIEV